jgi:hypothetical protein
MTNVVLKASSDWKLSRSRNQCPSFPLTIGCKGEPHKTFSKESYFSANEPVTPASLYLAQLRERLGDQAVKNIGH